MIWPLVIAAGGLIYDELANDGSGRKAIGNTAEDLYNDYMNVGQNKFKSTQAPVERQFYGGVEGGARAMADYGMKRADAYGSADAGAFKGLALDGRDPQAIEDQTLSDNEAFTRGWDQAGALQLNREAAMGQDPSIQLLESAAYGDQPSEAAWMMQRGLDQSLAQQQALAGGARGNAGIALAGGNMSGNAVGLQNQAFNNAGQLRAEEMAAARGQYAGAMGQARGQYADLANTVRGQDQSRLGMGNQMGQFNATNNDQFRMGMGDLGVKYGQQGLGWYQASQDPYIRQLNADLQYQDQRSGNFNQDAARRAGINQANADARRDQTNKAYGALGTVIEYGGKYAAGA